MAVCAIEDCERRVYRADLCRRHHYRLITYGDPRAGGPLRNRDHGLLCSVPGCCKPYLARGLCGAHYQRRAAHGDPLYQELYAKDQPCIVRGCTARQIAKGYCGKHYQRAARHGDPTTRLIGPAGKGGVTADGYRMLFRPGHPNAARTGRIAEHRLVMSEMLGRPLYPDESVHHRNGNRLDNRPQNLELWLSTHHPGQRVADLLAWAREIIARYGELEGHAALCEPAEDRRRD